MNSGDELTHVFVISCDALMKEEVTITEEFLDDYDMLDVDKDVVYVEGEKSGYEEVRFYGETKEQALLKATQWALKQYYIAKSMADEEYRRVEALRSLL